ncbi:hypothetical protein L6452_07256 [Arctium lappa]|uniref:Uncharacterized protein n=1 Tax=Arctium lappa TaxID=4217 RepID=A0ACB9EKS9_ARCLA|nr:hypothetical protein L6452_07256 [Arctium lappa]
MYCCVTTFLDKLLFLGLLLFLALCLDCILSSIFSNTELVSPLVRISTSTDLSSLMVTTSVHWEIAVEMAGQHPLRCNQVQSKSCMLPYSPRSWSLELLEFVFFNGNGELLELVNGHSSGSISIMSCLTLDSLSASIRSIAYQLPNLDRWVKELILNLEDLNRKQFIYAGIDDEQMVQD